MAQLSDDRQAKGSQGKFFDAPVKASTTIYAGALVAILLSSGMAQPMTDTTGVVFGGVAMAQADNSAGANGDIRVDVDAEGIFEFDGTGFAAADLGKAVYALSDHEVGLADDSTNKIFVGTITRVIDSTHVRVKIHNQRGLGAGDLASLQGDISTVQTDLGTAQDDITTIVQEYTDHRRVIMPYAGISISGDWTPGQTSNLPFLERAPAANSHVVLYDIGAELRDADNKGLKLTSYSMAYAVNTAALDNVKLELLQVTYPAHGSIPTVSVLAGANDGEYDGSHDTANERSATNGSHKLTVTVPTPDYINGQKGLQLRLSVDGDAGGTGEFKAFGIVLNFSKTQFDV